LGGCEAAARIGEGQEEARRREVRSANMAKKNAVPNAKVALYEQLIATNPEIERKGDANPYTSVNGNMFTMLHQGERLAIRLPEEEREKFLKKYKTALFEAHGAVMKEYVAVPDSLLAKTKELKKYLDLSYTYAKTLKAKPTTKKKQ
jgi:TfoX/Sxy family transcriptional regulator of competence genes